MVVIRTTPDAAEHAPSLTGPQAVILDQVEAKWGGMCRVYSEAYGLPDGWIQAMIYRESGGNEGAFRREPNGWTGIGLLQITYPALKGHRKVTENGVSRWVGGKSDEEVFRPSTNLDIGAKYIASLMKTYGNDFPKVAAAFNAGSVRPSNENPWGMHSTGNHISAEVAALNYWIRRHKVTKNDEDTIELIDLVELARQEDERARRDTDPPPSAV